MNAATTNAKGPENSTQKANWDIGEEEHGNRYGKRCAECSEQHRGNSFVEIWMGDKIGYTKNWIEGVLRPCKMCSQYVFESIQEL